MPNRYPFDYDSKPTQPPDCGVMTNKEIEAERIRILESGRFTLLLEESLSNRTVHRNDEFPPTLTFVEIGLIGYYIGMADKEGLYRYMKELLGPDIERIISKTQFLYRLNRGET